MANVLVIGSGGREHALYWKLKQSENVQRIFCTPGNGGIDDCLDYSVDDFEGILDFCKEYKIELAVIGPEAPLCDGIVDFLDQNGIKAFGPTKNASRIEGSKVFAKEFMKRYDIPTADFNAFDDYDDARDYTRNHGAPIVIKADGLAAGKGSIVCKTLDEANQALDDILVKKKFKDAGSHVVVEDFMEGEEASILALTDGTAVRTLASSQDHKPAYDGDRGPNTGGMGAYAPAPIVTPEVMDMVYKNILVPTIQNMAQEGNAFLGCLYAGLMIKENEPYVVEFNVRFGDPEAQPVLCLLDNDLYQLLKACVDGNLDQYEIRNKPGSACTVVMASGGYPGKYEKGKEILGLDDAKHIDNLFVFHAGTKREGKILTNGGRVLGPTGIGQDLGSAIEIAYRGGLWLAIICHCIVMRLSFSLFVP
jgi:phosphoribosylamine--glycine ligase